jgi:adenylate cyclase
MNLFGRLSRALFGDRADERLPERVQRAIDAEQQASELVIAWAQFAVVAVFGTLYAVSPKTFRPDAAFAPVPWVLGAYFTFTLLRIHLSHRRFLPRWFLALSVVADIGLLMALIWSFHVQYEQPAAFYLKAPTLLYVFIFIALRALRFEVLFVALAGLAAAAGWLALLFYAVVLDPAAAPVTRNYVMYMTSNHVLVGAEFDKIISILVTTAIIALAIVRARRLLVRAVAEQAAARELKRFFAPEIAEAITDAEQRIEPGRGVVREAAILHCDIRGFTALAQRVAPDALMQLLADYQARMVAEIRRHGGSVDKFLGDGILASFGAARPSATYAADAMRAVAALAAAARDWAASRRAANAEPLAIGVAVAVGPVVFGAVGDASRLEYTVIGEPVNLVARLDKQCKAEKCLGLTTAASLAAAEAQGYRPPARVERRAGRRVEGIDGPLDLVVLER